MSPRPSTESAAVQCCVLSLNTGLRDHFSTTENGRTRCNTCSMSFKCCCTSLRLHIQQQHSTFEITEIMKINRIAPAPNIKTDAKKLRPSRVSNVWDHFTKTRHGLASCDVCKVVLSIRGGQMNLRKHLRIQHSTYLRRLSECIGREIAIEQDEETVETTPTTRRKRRLRLNSTTISEIKTIPTTPVKIETEFIDFAESADVSITDEDISQEDVSVSGDAFDDTNEKRSSIGGSSDYEPDVAEPNSDSSANEIESDGGDVTELTDYLKKSSARGQFTFPTPDVAKCKGCNTQLSFKFKGTGNLIKHLKSELHIRRSNRDEIPPLKRNPASSPQKSSDIWNHMTKLKDNKVKCNLCSVKLQAIGKSNLTNHLRACHQLLVTNDQDEEAPGSKTEDSMKHQEQLEEASSTLVNFDDDNDNIPLSEINDDDSAYENLVNADKADTRRYGTIKKTKTSPVWNHYSEITKEIVQCLACDRTIKTTDGASSNLLKHLRNKHPHLLTSMTQPYGESFFDSESESEVQSIAENDENTTTDQNKVTKASAVWKHFTKQSGNKSLCNLCQHLLSGNGGTSNLYKHLRARHKNEANEIISMRIGRGRFRRILKKKAKAKSSKMPTYQLIWNHFSEPSLGLAQCNTCDMQILSADGDRANLRKNMRQHMNENHSDVMAELRRSHLDAMSLKRRNVTGMWRFFTRITDIDVECDLCHARLEHSGRSSYVLLKHMNAQHFDMRDTWKPKTNVPSTERSPLKRQRPLNWRPELKRPRSVLWSYFEPKNDRRAECLACHKAFSALSTSNLWKHLCAKHADIANAISKNAESYDESQMVDVGAEEFVATEADTIETENFEMENSNDEVNDASKIIVEYMDENWKLEIPLATPQ